MLASNPKRKLKLHLQPLLPKLKLQKLTQRNQQQNKLLKQHPLPNQQVRLHLHHQQKGKLLLHLQSQQEKLLHHLLSLQEKRLPHLPNLLERLLHLLQRKNDMSQRSNNYLHEFLFDWNIIYGYRIRYGDELKKCII